MSSTRVGGALTNRPSVDAAADGPVNQPSTSTTRLPPLLSNTSSPAALTGTIASAARVSSAELVLRLDDGGGDAPAGNAVQ